MTVYKSRLVTVKNCLKATFQYLFKASVLTAVNTVKPKT